jgi:hypothetical protein
MYNTWPDVTRMSSTAIVHIDAFPLCRFQYHLHIPLPLRLSLEMQSVTVATYACSSRRERPSFRVQEVSRQLSRSSVSIFNALQTRGISQTVQYSL